MNAKSFFIISLIVPLVLGMSNVYGASFNTVQVPTSNAVVDEDLPDKNYGNWPLITAGWSNPIQVGQGLKQASTYLQYNLTEIPNTDIINVVSIDSAQLHLLTKEIWGDPTTTKYLVTVSYCANNSWSETEITWNNRVCQDRNELVPGDSVIVNKDDLPTVYSWDVTDLVRDARSSGLSSITLVITAFPMQGILPTNSNSTAGSAGYLVWFWSKETGNQFGNSAEPTLEVDYSVTTPLIDNLVFVLTVIVPSAAVMIPAFIWLYRREKKRLPKI